MRSPFTLILGTALLLCAAPAAAQGNPATPGDLSAAREITIRDTWTGFSPVAPTVAEIHLVRGAGGWTGTAAFSVASGATVRRATTPVALPDTAIARFLAELARTPLRPGPYHARIVHTDDYPAIGVDLILPSERVAFTTASQGEHNTPWRVTIAGAEMVTDSSTVSLALASLHPRLSWDVYQSLMRGAMVDPESSCVSEATHDPEPSRRYYAGNLGWFAANEPLTFNGVTYRKYGMPRAVGLDDLARVGEYRGADVFMAKGAQAPGFVFVQVDTRCNVQAYMDVNLGTTNDSPR